ncbi:unnamed protein product, partial [Ascophyllum nodosum]
MIADIVVGAKAPSEAWKILNSIVENENSDRARELAKKQFEELSMNDDEPMKECIARAKSLALDVKYHGIELTDQEISRRILNGLPPLYAPEKKKIALKTDFSLAELEGGLPQHQLRHQRAQQHVHQPQQQQYQPRHQRKQQPAHQQQYQQRHQQYQQHEPQQQYQNYLHSAFVVQSGGNEDDVWIADSGASYHMTHDKT